MGRFKGIETYSLDSKDRVIIPAKMRKNLSPEAEETFILTRGFEKCIYAYPLDEWKKEEERLAKLDKNVAENRFVLRMMLRYSEEAKLDSHQRIKLPKELMKLAGIKNKATIAGVLNHLEFWDPEEYEKYFEGFEEDYESVAQRVMSGKE